MYFICSISDIKIFIKILNNLYIIIKKKTKKLHPLCTFLIKYSTQKLCACRLDQVMSVEKFFTEKNVHHYKSTIGSTLHSKFKTITKLYFHDLLTTVVSIHLLHVCPYKNECEKSKYIFFIYN